MQQQGNAVVHDLPGVGQHLHDHIAVMQVVDTPGFNESFGRSLAGAWRTPGDIREWRDRQSGRLTTNFAEAGAFFPSQPALDAPDLQLHFVIGKRVNHGRKTVFGHGYSCHVGLLHPKSRGSVQLASADPLATPLDRPSLPCRPARPGTAGRRLQAHERGWRSPRGPAWAVANWRCRAVVDAKVGVHGIAGPRMVDATILPSIVGGNTNAPTIRWAQTEAA